MLKNIIKTFFRQAAKNKTTFFINIIGLTLGLSSAILVFLWVHDELTFDRFHQNIDNLYRVVIQNETSDQIIHQAVTPGPLAPALKNEFPEIIKATRCNNFGEWIIKKEDNIYKEKNVAFVDPDFLDMFSFPIVKDNGSPQLVEPFTMMLSENMAKKYFGDDDLIGKTILFAEKHSMQITGVFKNVPENSSLQFDILVPFEYLRERVDIDFWRAHTYYSFVQLQPDAPLAAVNTKIRSFLQKYIPEKKNYVYLQPFGKIHLHSNLSYDMNNRGSIKYVWIFSALAVFILLIAGINYIILTTAQFSRRLNEIGMRKIFGSSKRYLCGQFFLETLIITLFALLLSLLLIDFVLPAFNQISGKSFQFTSVLNHTILAGSVAITILTAFLAGAYPSLVLSNYQPFLMLKSTSLNKQIKTVFRASLIILQFMISIFLITGTIIISKQLSFIQNKDLGFTKDQVIYLRMKKEFLDNYSTFKDKLKQNTNIANVTASFQLPSNIGSSPGDYDWEGKQPGQHIRMNAGLVDYDYFETFDMNIVKGRPFSKNFAGDDSAAYIVNETAVKAMGMENPIGKRFSFWDSPGYIVGVVKDFHAQPLHYNINPVVLKIDSYWLNYIFIKINGHQIPATIDFIKKTYGELAPNDPFEYRFLDESIERTYRAEQNTSALVSFASVLTILLAGLGLFGLTRLTVEQRKKEIGIRKIVGASLPQLFTTFTIPFIKLVLAAGMIAAPLAWCAMNKWLQNFAYRIDLTIWPFLLAGVSALVIALLTISFQTIRAATANPVESLRYE